MKLLCEQNKKASTASITFSLVLGLALFLIIVFIFFVSDDSQFAGIKKALPSFTSIDVEQYETPDDLTRASQEKAVDAFSAFRVALEALDNEQECIAFLDQGVDFSFFDKEDRWIRMYPDGSGSTFVLEAPSAHQIQYYPKITLLKNIISYKNAFENQMNNPGRIITSKFSINSKIAVLNTDSTVEVITNFYADCLKKTSSFCADQNSKIQLQTPFFQAPPFDNALSLKHFILTKDRIVGMDYNDNGYYSNIIFPTNDYQIALMKEGGSIILLFVKKDKDCKRSIGKDYLTSGCFTKAAVEKMKNAYPSLRDDGTCKLCAELLTP